MRVHEASGWTVAQQPGGRRKGRSAAFGCLLMAAVWLIASGCNSIYHRAETELPPEPGAELTVRLDEARKAETLATQAASRLRNDLARGLAGETVQADLDRLEMAASELQRRSAAALDVAGSAKEHPESAREIERLQQRAKAWLEYVQAARKADPSAQMAQLDNLIRGHPLTAEGSGGR